MHMLGLIFMRTKYTYLVEEWILNSVLRDVIASLYTAVFINKMLFLSTNLQEKTKKEKLKIAAKLHRQFAHPHSSKLKIVLKDAQILAYGMETY